MFDFCNHCMSELDNTANICPVCGKQNNVGDVPPHHLLPGTILSGKFYVGRAIGEGGFGITYIGRDTKLDMKVAIKEFYPNGCVNRNHTMSPRVSNSVADELKNFFETGKDRFLKEARVLAKFSGEPGIVGVRDFFEENNTAYIIMEYLDGVDLKHYLKNKGRLTPEQTLDFMMPVMIALKKIHAQGMIHRDISPDNIMLIGNRVKLLDFGAARNVSANENKSLSIMLKPGYAPEEQYRSKGTQGPWTDIYALCATMYKCITGITPDDATQRVFSDEVKAPSALGIKIPKQFENTIMRGMSVHQKDRFQSIDELLVYLDSKESESVTEAKTIKVEDSIPIESNVQVNNKAVPPVVNQPVKQASVPQNRVPNPAYVQQNRVVQTPSVQQNRVAPPQAPIQQNRVAPMPQPVITVQPQPQKKNTLGVVIGIVAGVLVILGIVVAILFATGTIGDSGSSSSNSAVEEKTKEKTTEPTTEDVIDNTPLFLTYEMNVDFYDTADNYVETRYEHLDIPFTEDMSGYGLDNVPWQTSYAWATEIDTGFYCVELYYMDESEEIELNIYLYYTNSDFSIDNLYAHELNLRLLATTDDPVEYSEIICYDKDANFVIAGYYEDGVMLNGATNSGYTCVDGTYYDNEFNVIDEETYLTEEDRALNEVADVIYGR